MHLPAPRPNLLITHDHHHADAARANAEGVLEELEAGARFLPSRHPGVFEVFLPGDPRRVLRKARDLCRQDPRRFAHTHHWRPVDAWSRAELSDMREAVEGLADRIGPRDRWRLTLDIHGASRWHSRDLVTPLTEPVKGGTVDLRHPGTELRVDLLGERAAFSVLAEGQDLDVDRVREVTMHVAQDV